MQVTYQLGWQCCGVMQLISTWHLSPSRSLPVAPLANELIRCKKARRLLCCLSFVDWSCSGVASSIGANCKEQTCTRDCAAAISFADRPQANHYMTDQFALCVCTVCQVSGNPLFESVCYIQSRTSDICRVTITLEYPSLWTLF